MPNKPTFRERVLYTVAKIEARIAKLEERVEAFYVACKEAIKKRLQKADDALRDAGPKYHDAAEAEPKARSKALFDAAAQVAWATLLIPAAGVLAHDGAKKAVLVVSGTGAQGVKGNVDAFFCKVASWLFERVLHAEAPQVATPEFVQNIFYALVFSGLIVLSIKKGHAFVEAIQEWKVAVKILGCACLGYLGWFEVLPPVVALPAAIIG